MNFKKAMSVESDGHLMLPPRGVTILLVDSDSACLLILSKMLRCIGYEVLTAKLAADAFFIAQRRQGELDLILAETHLPDMGKYELLEKLGELRKLPVIVMSADGNEYDILGALFKGAELYLVKPITLDDIKYLWQIAFRKRKGNMVAKEAVSSISSDVTDNRVFTNKGHQRHQDAKRKVSTEVDRNEEEETVYSSALKKSKLTWTSELHNKFLQAIREIGIDEAHPKAILQHMKVPGLKKENISSHLQKYRLALKREQDAICKTTEECYSESQIAVRNLSSTGSVQGCLLQFPERKTMTASHHPELGSQEQTNDVNFCIPMPSVDAIHFLHNGGLSCNDGELAPATSQIDFYYPFSSYAGIEITSKQSLANFHQIEECLVGKMDPFSYVQPNSEIAMELPLLVPKQEEKHQQQQNLFPPESTPIRPEEYGVYGAENFEIDEFFMGKGEGYEL